jgi:hypothetical protein
MTASYDRPTASSDRRERHAMSPMISERSFEEQFLKRLASEIERRGTLEVLRNGIQDRAASFSSARTATPRG